MTAEQGVQILVLLILLGRLQFREIDIVWFAVLLLSESRILEKTFFICLSRPTDLLLHFDFNTLCVELGREVRILT